MSDRVTCKAVLVKRSKDVGADSLYLAVPPDWNLRILACRPEGEPKREPDGRPEWQYGEGQGLLLVKPSLLASDTGFHTAYDWECAYEVCPSGVSGYEHFYELNPQLRKEARP